MKDKIIQVSGFGVNNTRSTQCDFIIIALTKSGKVIINMGGSEETKPIAEWYDITPKQTA